ncbi:putative membrane protein [Arachidicoccus rhizosphaerae]|uniref:Putative membrane protein n=1 Tax=Arachidicoccus rhizosphaerae TaxID=551991 RepID=A0A1H3YCY2_9BACT|nr:DUF202 domain-containing protein [Arachidicoccus rhizosphaerae]SEA09446.1 putative membrane protein [Arachidicoccus rhizosphaerae]
MDAQKSNQQQPTPQITNKKPPVSDHLANERTFLAWVRTSIGIMGFGFVVVKFSLFVRQISIALNATSNLPPSSGYSQFIGLFLVAMGGIVLGVAYLRYQKTKRQIQQGDYYHSDLLIKLSTAMIFVACVFLIAYLYWNLSFSK